MEEDASTAISIGKSNMGHKERAWTAQLSGDGARAADELRYTEQPAGRALRCVAEALQRMGEQRALAWLETANVGLGGRSLRGHLRFDDPETWLDVSRIFRVHIDVDAILSESGHGYPV